MFNCIITQLLVLCSVQFENYYNVCLYPNLCANWDGEEGKHLKLMPRK